MTDTGLVPTANTDDPDGPFFIDLTGHDRRTTPPTRDPRTRGYPPAEELPDATLPRPDRTGNFIVGPTRAPAPETERRAEGPHGRLVSFSMTSDESTVYRPGVVRHEDGFNATVNAAVTLPNDPSDLQITTSSPGSWERTVTVYIPTQPAVAEGAYPLLVVGDGDVAFGGGTVLTTVLDNLIADGRVPPLAAVLIGSGGQDAQGSQRGREYDTVSATFAHWVETEVLPLAEEHADIRLTRDPEGRAAVGISSSGVAAFTMAWFRPDLYRRVLAYSPTFVNQQWPHDPALPGGAWEYHSRWPGPHRPHLAVRGILGAAPTQAPSHTPLLHSAPRKPIRFWYLVGDRDFFYPIPAMVDGMHDWVLASERMAAALEAKGYEYQFLFARDAGHCDEAAILQTLPLALQWLWRDYEPNTAGSGPLARR